MSASTITVGQLRRALQALPSTLNDSPIYVWLPGSAIALPSPQTLSLGGHPHKLVPATSVLIEGNVVPGSALEG